MLSFALGVSAMGPLGSWIGADMVFVFGLGERRQLRTRWSTGMVIFDNDGNSKMDDIHLSQSFQEDDDVVASEILAMFEPFP